jgi:hypothetical protein
VRIAFATLIVLTTIAAIGVWRTHRHHDAAAVTVTTSVAHTTRVRRPTLPPDPGPLPGYLLIADRGNDRILLISNGKRILWRYPRRGHAPDRPLYFDDDTFFGPDARSIITNQEEQHTIQVISFPAGHVLWTYGHVGVRGSAPGYLNTPDDAYLLPNGLRSVADAYNCRILFISPAKRIVRQIGRTRGCAHDPPRSLGAVNGATPLADGGTLVSEIPGSWIDDFDRRGRLRWAVRAPVSYPSDPQLLAPNRILLADYTRPGQIVVMTRSGRVVWRYGVRSGQGELDHPSLATRFAPGLIAVNDDFRHRVVLISMRSHRIVWQYGHTDVKGTAPGYLNTPDGMDLLPRATVRRLPALRRLVTQAARR